jgi:uncharacterized protein (UPF0248 family)
MARERKLTGREAYNRVFWDGRLNRHAFVIGFTDRLAPSGIGETPLPAWDVQGEIPWHRIQYIRCGGVTVWSRSEPEDRLASGDLPAEAWGETGTENFRSDRPGSGPILMK